MLMDHSITALCKWAASFLYASWGLIEFGAGGRRWEVPGLILLASSSVVNTSHDGWNRSHNRSSQTVNGIPCGEEEGDYSSNLSDSNTEGSVN